MQSDNQMNDIVAKMSDEEDCGLTSGEIAALASSGVWTEGGGVVRLTRLDHPYGRVLKARGYKVHLEDACVYLEPEPPRRASYEYRMTCGCMRLDEKCCHWKVLS